MSARPAPAGDSPRRRAPRGRRVWKLAGRASHQALEGLSGVLRLARRVAPGAAQVQVERDLAYRPGGDVAHRLDVYRPRGSRGPLPVVFYVHGGGFAMLSKESHWMMAETFARHGYLVFSINYRLAPRHPFPAAVQDVCAAYLWLQSHGEALGADLDRVAVAGDSAGGNLITSLVLTACYRRAEPWARAVFDGARVPAAALPACALLQATDIARLARRRPLWPGIDAVLRAFMSTYLKGYQGDPVTLELSDPIRVLEREDPPDRPLPPFCIETAGKDPLLPDSRRLDQALRARGVASELHLHPGAIHVFHAGVVLRSARRCWRQQLAFLERHMGTEAPARRRAG